MNVIARPNHDVWKIKDPQELREWFQKGKIMNDVFIYVCMYLYMYVCMYLYMYASFLFLISYSNVCNFILKSITYQLILQTCQFQYTMLIHSIIYSFNRAK